MPFAEGVECFVGITELSALILLPGAESFGLSLTNSSGCLQSMRYYADNCIFIVISRALVRLPSERLFRDLGVDFNLDFKGLTMFIFAYNQRQNGCPKINFTLTNILRWSCKRLGYRLYGSRILETIYFQRSTNFSPVLCDNLAPSYA
ncbi:hypothetical protein KQX54_002480 [Cotesia glomerata]|uniref:Uncharacterized protein n=1 Tax=Cotesia glomerata TaxID=32391 RepID=A0AAV7IFV5_COTGL|nr:hypothetical protein KQX54_002480 [Cotesia glomerata]